jgi:predicted permease
MPFEPLRRVKPLLRAIFGRRTLEQEMQAEMRDHMERATQRLIARGLSPEQARLEAGREFGNASVIQEQARDAQGPRWLEALVGDVRFAFRYFVRHRATVAIIVAVLAIGTGANTMLFSLFQAEFVRPAPAVEYDGRMARIWAQERPTKTGTWKLRGFTYPELRTFAERKDLFSEIAAYATQTVVVGGRDGTEARAVGAQFVTSNYFGALRVPLAAGAGFARQANEVESTERTAVLSHAMATTLYGDPATAIGRSISVNEVPLQVVGVAPPKFQGAMRKMDDPGLWIPLSARAEIAGVSPRWLAESPILYPFARLAAGASHEEATDLARRTVLSTLPDSAARVGLSRTADVMSMGAVPPGPDRVNSILALIVLGTVGVLILFVGWMNVSSLMVAAAIARRQEIAVRLSLGASRVRLLRQLVTESTVLALAGGAAGLAMAWLTLTAMLKIGLGGIDLMPDAGTFTFALGVALVTGILFGLSPALHATRGEVGTAIRDSGAGSTKQSKLQRTFVTAQIALSQPLLVLLGTLLWMLANDFDTKVPELGRRVIFVNASPIARNGQQGQPMVELDSLRKRIAEHPEVVGVVPEGRQFDKGWVVAPGQGSNAAEDSVRTVVNLQGIAPGWFAMADVPIIVGRDVSLADTAGTAAIPVVVGSDLAKALWGDANPIGRTIGAPQLHSMQDAKMVVTVVGVYDASGGVPGLSGIGGGGNEDEFRMYSARGKNWFDDMMLVRTRGAAEPFINDLRALIRDRAPSLPIESMETVAQMKADMNAESLQGAGMAMAGGIVALLLTSLGLYGVVSLAVQQRTREIGIRIAVGANPAGVTQMFLRSGVRIAGIALLIGLPVTVIGMRVGQATGVINEGPNFWLVGLGVSVVLIAVASAATWAPARRASRVDPAIALRVE